MIRVRYIPMESVNVADANPKQHDVPTIVESIKRFGFAQPLLVNESTGKLLAGHGRLSALRLMQQRGNDVPDRVKEKNGKWLVPVLQGVSIDDDIDAAAYLLADNNLVSLGGWDDEALDHMIQELGADGLDGTGFEWPEDDTEEPDAEEGGADDSENDKIPEEVEALTVSGETVELGDHVLHCGDCIDVLRDMRDETIDSVVTDPPYGIGFMGKGWDCAVPGMEFAQECFRVLKPGGHLIAFAATRTVHRLTVALEDAGFEIRDQIAWMQWQGFPKSLDVSKAIDSRLGEVREVVGHVDAPGSKMKEMSRGGDGGGDGHAWTGEVLSGPVSDEAKNWDGWGTALKPSYEPAILVRKPMIGTVADNVLKHGVGAINVDACRYAYGDRAWPGPGGDNLNGGGYDPKGKSRKDPANATSYATATMDREFVDPGGRWPANLYHCPKPSTSERNDGCEELPEHEAVHGRGHEAGGLGVSNAKNAKTNNHPTVKPVELMRWLVRLVTPKGGTVLEPFCGSGTTLVAVHVEGARCIAIEREPMYCDIIRARYEAAARSKR